MAIDTSRLSIDLSKEDGWRRVLQITVPGDLVEQEERRTAKKLAKDMDPPPGFRKGKVPTHVVKQRYGAALRREAVDQVVQDAYREALKARELRPISKGEVRDIQYEPEDDLKFEVAFDVEPTVELSRLGGFSVERPALEVDEGEVDQVLERVREQHGVWQPVEEGAPQDGDQVSVAIERQEDDGSWSEPSDYEFQLGKNEALPDIEEAIQSLEVGATGEFDLSLPGDAAQQQEDGDSSKVRITLRGRKALELPELNDDLAKEAADVEDLEGLREKIRSDMKTEAGREAEKQVRQRLLDAVLEANPFEVPASMVDQYMESVLGEQKDQIPEEKLAEIREAMKGEAESAVKRFMVVDRIAADRNLKATEDEVDEKVQEIAESNEVDPQQVYGQLQKAGRLDALEREITEDKVFDFLKQESTITDEEQG